MTMKTARFTPMRVPPQPVSQTFISVLGELYHCTLPFFSTLPSACNGIYKCAGGCTGYVSECPHIRFSFIPSLLSFFFFFLS
jgi:hypothetical protein